MAMPTPPTPLNNFPDDFTVANVMQDGQKSALACIRGQIYSNIMAKVRGEFPLGTVPGFDTTMLTESNATELLLDLLDRGFTLSYWISPVAFSPAGAFFSEVRSAQYFLSREDIAAVLSKTRKFSIDTQPPPKQQE